jgi:hypothetical protein
MNPSVLSISMSPFGYFDINSRYASGCGNAHALAMDQEFQKASGFLVGFRKLKHLWANLRRHYVSFIEREKVSTMPLAWHTIA